MIKIIDLEKESLTDFEKKYMFTEAPEEKERVNVKHIRLKAPDKRTYDFRKGASDEEDEQPPAEPDDIAVDDVDVEEPVGDTTDPVTTDDSTTDDEDDIVTDDESTTEVEGDNGNEETIDMNDDSTEDTGDGDIVTDDNSDTESDDGGDDSNEDDQTNIDMNNDSGDDIVTDDSGDISTDDGSGDGAGDGDNSSDDSSDNGGDEDSKNEGIHKQNLYRKFVSLKTSIDNYDHKLSSIIGIDPETHKMIHEITDKFKSLSDMMYDYMILKFRSNTYLESMLFYQRAMAATNLCLDALSKVSEASEDDNKKKSKKSNKK